MEQTTQKKIKQRTITTMFMVPTLRVGGGNYETHRHLLTTNKFMDGFSKDGMKEAQYEDSIYLLFRPNDLDLFREFLEDEYERTTQIIDDYDYPEGFVVVVYKLDPKFRKDFELIKSGKYSKTSLEFQELFPREIKVMDRREITLLYSVFNKTRDIVKYWEDELDITLGDDVEVWYGYDENRETLTKDKLKKYLENYE